MAANTSCMRKMETTITSHTGLPHQDTGRIISMPKLVSPEIETSSSLPLYVNFINAVKHTNIRKTDIHMLNPFWFFQVLLHEKGLLVV